MDVCGFGSGESVSFPGCRVLVLTRSGGGGGRGLVLTVVLQSLVQRRGTHPRARVYLHHVGDGYTLCLAGCRAVEGKCHFVDLEIRGHVPDLGFGLGSWRGCVQLMLCRGDRCTGQAHAATVQSKICPVIVCLNERTNKAYCSSLSVAIASVLAPGSLERAPHTRLQTTGVNYSIACHTHRHSLRRPSVLIAGLMQKFPCVSQ